MKKGEIWLINFDPQIGDEIKKIRPAVIISSNNLGGLALRIVAPISSSLVRSYSWHVDITPSNQNGLKKKSFIDCNEIKSLSTKRFINSIGLLSEEEMIELKLGLIKTLELY